MKEVRWTPKYRFFAFLHKWVNKAAWKFAKPSGPVRGRALRINDNKFWWVLNNWVANNYIPWWIEEATGIKRNRITKEVK